jgi:hypothetical protein
MRRATKIVAAAGVSLAVILGLWLLIAPGQLVKYPSDLNKTAVATGTLTLYLDPATGTARSSPESLPLEIRRHVWVADSTGSQATVRESSAEKVGPLPGQTIQQQYVIDRSSLENVTSSQAYAYTPVNLIDRAPYYSINLPFGTGAGPYKVWKNEAAVPYEFKQAGDEVQRDGVTLIPMTGSLRNAPADPAYIDQLKGQGFAKTMTARQMAAQLKAQGVDLQALSAQVLPQLAPAQRKLMQLALAEAVPLNYYVSAQTRLLVEPKTGAIVSLDSIDQTLTVAPDLAGFARVADVLAQPPLSRIPAVQKASQTIGALAKTPPVKVVTMHYGQTPQSVADFAAYAQDKANGIDLVERTIPLALAILTALALIATGVMTARDRRRQEVRA